MWTRYYSGVVWPHTTRSWGRTGRLRSTLGLVTVCGLVGSSAFRAQDRAPVTSSVFPSELIWTARFEGVPTEHMAATTGHLLLLLRDSRLLAFSLATGSLSWTLAEASNLRPAIDGDLVAVADGRRLRGVDETTGQVRWEATLPAPPASAPVAGGGWLIVPIEGGLLEARRGQDGSVIWTRPLAGNLTATPTIAGDRLLCSVDDKTLLVLDIETGEPLWSQTLGERPATPLVVDGKIYVGAKTNFLYSFDERSGRELWRWRTGGDIVGEPAVDATHLYFVSLDNLLRALDRRSGNLRWQRALSSRARSGPVVVGDTILVSSYAPEVRAFSVFTGRPTGKFEIPAELLAGPPVVTAPGADQAPLVLVASTAGRLFAYRRRLGLLVSPLQELPGELVTLVPPVPEP